MRAPALHIKQTQAFIDEEPVDIVVMRAPVETTTAGGRRRGAPVALPAQRVRKVPIGRVGALTQRTTEDGRVLVPTASVVALPDADLQPYDHFLIEGVDHEVLFVSDLPKWRITCEVIEHV